ncbi:uncharacterized protein involved in response to NO [Variovorax sp. TBS-050B]|uniref:NnrS family protein n=1 Tax=Variovorax sp. TBS-050B TaxID=2940551 RepID=UPI00247619AE|nr:NnrS family protein [Variovorax sp. TBS-050B]MDH6590594.1 uncharacterized protein involved in response to NO [Variovorax sp. TBS-050B]
MGEADAAARAEARRWRARHLLLAPHRLGFFLATLVLLAAALWWAAVQLMRGGHVPGLALSVSPSLVHAAVTSFGFMPLFFGGFLFTALPKWLHVPAPPARRIAPPLLAQAAGWLIWLAGSHVHRLAACAGLALAAGGLLGMAIGFGRMVHASVEPDRVHARLIGLALAFGGLCLMAVAACTAAGADRAAIGWVRSGLWGFVVAVFLVVAHRLIPFFTSELFPASRWLRQSWSLWAMAGLAAFEAGAELLEAAGGRSDMQQAARAGVELVAGAGVIWLCARWRLAQNLALRWVGMLHLGFLWLGLSLLLAAAARLLTTATGEVQLPLAGLHALGMGCLGTLMLTMVARISMAHAGRPVHAEGLLSGLLAALQAATLLRIAAALTFAGAQRILTLAALLWLALMFIWGIRHASWYGRPRADHRPG